jgi:hypothetical protein
MCVCQPFCATGMCGDMDGCGGTCMGTCSMTGYVCARNQMNPQLWQCVPSSCPGGCSAGEVCNAGHCVPGCPNVTCNGVCCPNVTDVCVNNMCMNLG